MRLHPDVELLLEIQDLLQYRTLTVADVAPPLSFEDDRTHEIGARIAEREAQLSPRTRTMYDRLAAHLERIIVPVIDGVCSGCRIRVPTGIVSAHEIGTCQTCGRFLYSPEAA